MFRNLYVYDDGLIKGFVQMNGTEVCKLYVEPCFQNGGIGRELLEFAVWEHNADCLWALEGTAEYLIELKREKKLL